VDVTVIKWGKDNSDAYLCTCCYQPVDKSVVNGVTVPRGGKTEKYEFLNVTIVLNGAISGPHLKTSVESINAWACSAPGTPLRAWNRAGILKCI
jgi:hypothetical protein